jgi:hypothetical protein
VKERSHPWAPSAPIPTVGLQPMPSCPIGARKFRHFCAAASRSDQECPPLGTASNRPPTLFVGSRRCGEVPRCRGTQRPRCPRVATPGCPGWRSVLSASDKRWPSALFGGCAPSSSSVGPLESGEEVAAGRP